MGVSVSHERGVPVRSKGLRIRQDSSVARVAAARGKLNPTPPQNCQLIVCYYRLEYWLTFLRGVDHSSPFTSHPSTRTPHLSPLTPHPSPRTPHLSPFSLTIHPLSSIPRPSTLNPQPSTRTPSPPTLKHHPPPFTPHAST